MKRLIHSLCLSTVLLSLGARDKDFEWPTETSDCPSFVRLDRSAMGDHDMRQEKNLRRRPWPDDKGKIEHAELEISNLRIHHVLDQIAVHVNSGSPDKPRVNGQVASFTKITFKNLDIGHVYRNTPGLHMDHIWVGPGHDDAFRPDVTFEDVFIHDSNGGVMPILFENGGKWGTLTLRRVAVVNCKHSVMIKLKNSSFKEIIIDECPGLRVTMQGAGEPVTVKIRNSEGCSVATPRDNDGQEARVEVVYE